MGVAIQLFTITVVIFFAFFKGWKEGKDDILLKLKKDKKIDSDTYIKYKED